MQSKSIHCFEGFQQDIGFFSTSRNKVAISLNLSSFYFVKLEGGYPQQISKKQFTMTDLNQIQYATTICTSLVTKTTKQQMALTYSVVFTFVDTSIVPVTVLMDDQEFKKMKQTFIDLFPQPRRNLLFIKQHIVEKQIKTGVNGPNSLAGTLPQQQTQKKPVFSKLDLTQATVTSHSGTSEQPALSFEVSIKQKDKQGIYVKIISVFINKETKTLQLNLKGSASSHDVIQCQRESGATLDVSLRGSEQWFIEFQSVYKAFQFLQMFLCSQPSEPPNLNVYVQTWNMARDPQDLDFARMIPCHMKYNLIVWGAQECERKMTQVQMHRLRQHLGDQFVQIQTVEMWEMFLVAFIRKDDFLRLNPSSIQSNYITLGVMNIIGNKGALMLKFNLYNKSFSFINCHLVAGVKKGEQRCDMMGNALKGISLQKPQDRFEPDAAFDYNFIMGDLNMRFKSTYTDFIEFVDFAKDYIQDYDELYEQTNVCNRFPGYHEEPINFMPTYKCDSLSNGIYINKKDQCPSFTDRVLFKSNDRQVGVQYNKYHCRSDIYGSDHRPVYLDLNLTLSQEVLMEPALLLNPATPQQGSGKLQPVCFKLHFDQKGVNTLKRKLIMPMFLQLQFRSEWLCYQPFSDEKKISGIETTIPSKRWTTGLPTLFTPINSLQILNTKRLIVLIKMSEAKSEVQENFAYCVVQLNEVAEGINRVTGDIVGFNCKLGTYEADLQFDIIGAQDQMIEPIKANEAFIEEGTAIESIETGTADTNLASAAFEEPEAFVDQIPSTPKEPAPSGTDLIVQPDSSE